MPDGLGNLAQLALARQTRQELAKQRRLEKEKDDEGRKFRRVGKDDVS